MSFDPTLEAPETCVPVEEGCDPGARVLSWRIEQLIAVGFESEAAFVLALDRDVDLHEATQLVHRGCPPETAFRILV